MEFLLDILAFVIAGVLLCALASAVVLAASFIYVCIMSAKKASGKGEDENNNG